jgi:ribonuclease J
MKDFLDELDIELGDNTTDLNDDSWEKLILKEDPSFKKWDIIPSVEKSENIILGSKLQRPSLNSGISWNFWASARVNNSLNFPETKFYLPTLRDGYTRVIPIGGNNETGAKNMNMFQYGEEILLLDCWLQFAEPDMLGASYSIPDVSFLIQYKENIKGIIITHAHLDHFWSLKHILPALWMPTIFSTKLTIGMIKKQLEEAKILSYATFVEVDWDSTQKVKIGSHFSVEFFRVNHSVPDCIGCLIETPKGTRIVHTGDFKIDFTPAIDKPADLSRIKKIGEKGITLLLSDSTGSIRKWFSTSEKEIGETLEKIISQHYKGRLIITIFSSWISRVQQIIDACEKNGKFVFLSWRSMVDNVALSKELWYLTIKPHILRKMSPKTTEGIPAEKQVIITTGSQGEEFSALTRMAEGKHNSIEILAGDTIIFSSSVVPWNEKVVVGVINKLIRLWANVITKDDKEVHTWGHAFQEEQKIMLSLVNPKYFMPVYGDLYFRHLHKMTAIGMGVKEENILLLDNGNMIDFAPDNTVFKSRIKVPIQDLIIDGYGIGTTSSHVIKAREKMMNAWVLVVLFKADTKTKTILGHIKLETRGLVYVDEVRQIHRMIIKKAKDIYENTVKDIPDIEEKDLLKIIKTDMEAFLLQKIDREPMVIPMILEV